MPLNRQAGITRLSGLGRIQQFRADVTMDQALELAVCAYRAQQEANAAVLRERERCARICDRWPDNLMAAHLGKRIRGGK